jgi:hypothetical protein
MKGRRVPAAVVLVAAALAIPTAALAGGGGGGGGSVFIFTSTGPLRGHSVASEVEVKGSITVDFHGDSSAGCAAAHLCDVTGRVRWNPSGPGQIVAIGYRERGRRYEEGFMTLGQDFDPVRLDTSARVRRGGAPGTLCADGALQSLVDSSTEPRRGSTIALRLLTLPSASFAPTEVLRTDCAGPTTSDVAALLPARRVSERQLERGHGTLDYSVDAPFAAHGLAGIVHSTVVVKFGAGTREPLNNSSGTSGLPPGTHRVRERMLTVEYRVERVSGSVVTSVHGSDNPDACGPLDACGIAGSVTATPTASNGLATIRATGSARHSAAELRRALGLSRGPRPRGVQRYGDVFWQRDRGSVASDLTRDGAPACSDSLPIVGGGGLNLAFSGKRLKADYGTEGFGVTDLMRTHCPGPGGLEATTDFATGSFPVGILRQRRITLRLTHGGRYSSGGYSGRTSPDVTVVLRRSRVRSSVFTDIAENEHRVRSLR